MKWLSVCVILLLSYFYMPVSGCIKDEYVRKRPRICKNTAVAYKVYKTLVIACPGGWFGHVSNADLCGKGYHLCTKGDKDKYLSKINYDHASKICGCYAYNAAHDFGQCIDCENKLHHDDLGGIGTACPRKTKTQKTSCITGGTIDSAPNVNSSKNNKGCRYHSGISGVVCCKD